MTDAGDIETLILLVGSNPLPNYLTALALKPKTVCLVYSEETKSPKTRLRDALGHDLREEVDFAEKHVKDPYDGPEVSCTIDCLMETYNNADLHYTGGTKVMSAHSLKTFYERGGQKSSVSYLDETNACLRFDDGTTRTLSDYDVTITLERILQLHGIKGTPREDVSGGPIADDVLAMQQCVLAEPDVTAKFYEASNKLKTRKTASKASDNTFDPSRYELRLSVNNIPESADWERGLFKVWWSFLGGEWLEEWVAILIRGLQIDGISSDSVLTGIDCTRQETNREFEVDVSVIRNQRAFFVSCTTDRKLGLCKSKAFEITARSKQMGGDLARSALVCMLDGEDSNGPFVDQLQADLDDVWGASNTTKVFGLEDLRQWAGCCGSPNIDTLKEWLES